MNCDHDHETEAEMCPLCADDPEEAARRTATATGFAGSVLGAAAGPIGAGVNGLVWGTAGYLAGHAAASANANADDEDTVTIETKHEGDDDSDEDESEDAGDHDDVADDDAS